MAYEDLFNRGEAPKPRPLPKPGPLKTTRVSKSVTEPELTSDEVADTVPASVDVVTIAWEMIETALANASIQWKIVTLHRDPELQHNLSEMLMNVYFAVEGTEEDAKLYAKDGKLTGLPATHADATFADKLLADFERHGLTREAAHDLVYGLASMSALGGKLPANFEPRSKRDDGHHR